MKKKIVSVVLALSMMTAAVCGCSGKNSDSTTKNEESTTEAAELEEVDMRIVSVSPTVTEIIFALGYGANIVGVTSYDDYPADVFEIQQVGDTMAPDAEAIASLEPDIVFASDLLSEDALNAMEALELNVVVVSDGADFGDTLLHIEEIAAEIGANNAGLALTDELQERYDAITFDGETSDISIYYVVGYGEYGDYTAGAGTYVDAIITDAGAVNAGSEAEGWYISQEALIEADPDYILVPNWATDFETMEPYASLSAVVNGNVIYVDSNLFDRQGPRNIEAMELIQEIVAENAVADDEAA